jgi:hypothetical protein
MTEQILGRAHGGPSAPIELIPSRPLVLEKPDVLFRLAPGDRPLVEPGTTVVPGMPLAERARATSLEDAAPGDDEGLEPGRWWASPVTEGRRARRSIQGELLFPWRGSWRIAAADHADPLEAPVAGLVRDVRPGIGISVRTLGRGVPGIIGLGGPTRGRLQSATGPDGELRPGGLDVGYAGTVLVVGSRVDAETLTRARAMGVRGIVVAGLPSKERRDFLASEARQRAALHRLAPYAVLVLDGSARRPIAGAIMRLFEALEGHEVAIVDDPPMLVFDESSTPLPPILPDAVRVRSGPDAGREGRWEGDVALRRFERGVHLEAGRVRFSDGEVGWVPLGDLERFA